MLKKFTQNLKHMTNILNFLTERVVLNLSVIEIGVLLFIVLMSVTQALQDYFIFRGHITEHKNKNHKRDMNIITMILLGVSVAIISGHISYYNSFDIILNVFGTITAFSLFGWIIYNVVFGMWLMKQPFDSLGSNSRGLGVLRYIGNKMNFNIKQLKLLWVVTKMSTIMLLLLYFIF